ncbi:MAG: NAD-dependent epimerase/dehydratase family protein [Planctomycetota bacterium]
MSRVRSLVTGGAGFVGHHLVRLLAARGDHVTVVDNLATGRRRNIERVASEFDSDAIEFIDSDLRTALPGLPERGPFNEIYHLAAAVGVDLVMREPVAAIETNVEQTAGLFRNLPKLGPNGKPPRTLLTSSSEVYGKPTRQVFSEDDDVVYGPTTVARWSYGCAKAIDEYLALGHAQASGMPIVVVRLFNTVGPGQVGEYGMVLPRFVASAIEGKPLTVRGDGTQTRCFCDVRDVVSGFPRLLAEPKSYGRVFNIGSDQPISIKGLAETVVATLGSGAGVEFIPYSDVYQSGFEDLKHRRPDLSRIRGAIGFEPKIPLEQTIRDIAAQIRSENAEAKP